MSQKRKHSFFEQCLNTASGFILSYVISGILYPILHLKVSNGQNFVVVGVLTVVSVVRGYFWRRLFNWLQWREI